MIIQWMSAEERRAAAIRRANVPACQPADLQTHKGARPMPSHTEQLIALRQRYLEQLELQQAAMGLHTPPHIALDIAQTRAEIARIGAQRTQQMLRPQSLSVDAPPPMPGLLLLVSPQRPGEPLADLGAYQAIDYHRARLSHCWLIATGGEAGALATAQAIAQHFTPYGVACAIWQVINAASIAETFALVDWIYTSQVPASGLGEAEVIADITGATKPMTAGMVLACGARRPMQYMIFQQQGPSLPVALRVG